MIENHWRSEHCPEFGDLYCENAFAPCETCEGAWYCDDIDVVTEEVMAYYDTDNDGVIDPADDVEPEHYHAMVDHCDMNDDGSIVACEIWMCVMMIENQWRAEHCPNYGDLYCENVNYPCPDSCEGEWNCTDIDNILAQIFE
jgi:hypothetical protein